LDSRIIKPFPFLLREQGTKAGVTKSDSLHPSGDDLSGEFYG